MLRDFLKMLLAPMMPMGFFGTIAGAVAGPIIGDIFGGGGGGGAPSGGSGSGGGAYNGPKYYTPTNQGGMDQNYQNAFAQYQGAMNSSYGQMQPYMQQNFQNQYNNPAAQQFLQSQQNAGNQYGALSGQMGQSAQQMYGAGNQAYQTGFDPRGAIYNQNRNDLTENVRSGEYARGISMSPAGASVEADALGRFQNDWQNQQQTRQLAGLQGMGRAFGQGAEMQGQGAQYAGMAGALPYQAQNQVAQNQRGAVNDFYAAQQPYMSGLQQLQNNSLAYNNYATGAQNTAFNQNMKGLDYGNQLQQQFAPLGNQLGQAAGGAVQNWWNTPSGGMGNGSVDGSSFTSQDRSSIYSNSGYGD